MMTGPKTYPLRLPRSVKAAVEVLAEQEGVSVNQFIATAVAEKLTAMSTAQFFEARRKRADFQAFRRLMRRKRGQSPRSGDERG
jgi:hypothetical protein